MHGVLFYNNNIIIRSFFSFFWEGKMWNCRMRLLFRGYGGSCYELVFLGGGVGLWVLFRVLLRARGREGNGM